MSVEVVRKEKVRQAMRRYRQSINADPVKAKWYREKDAQRKRAERVVERSFLVKNPTLHKIKKQKAAERKRIYRLKLKETAKQKKRSSISI